MISKWLERIEIRPSYLNEIYVIVYERAEPAQYMANAERKRERERER